ncbi:MAG: ABC transporter permease [Chitinophagaceae bacterium]|nr:ABC transporter permease [Chitinophagaceae bacterium]
MIDVNTANLVTANFASRAIQTVLGTLNAGIEIESLKKNGMDENTARQRFEPFRATYTRFYNPSGNYLELMFPGVLGTVMQQIIFLGLGLVFARDLEDGYFKKLALKNKSAVYHILLKAIPFTILTSIVWLMVGCLATEVLMVVATPSFLLSGYTWPLDGMPFLIQQIAKMIPVTHFLQAFRKIGIYHGTLADIYPQLKALSIIAVTCMLLLVLIIKIKIIKANRRKNQLTAV